MQSRFAKLPIRGKLLVANLLVVSLALALACTAFVVSEGARLRESLPQELAAHADLVASNAATALLFEDSDAATEAVSALQAIPLVQRAELLDATGSVVARYDRAASSAVVWEDWPDAPGHRFLDDTLLVVRPITVGHRRVGSVRLRSSLDAFQAGFQTSLWIGAGVFVVALLAAMVVSVQVGHRIATPIRELAETAQQLTKARDYSRRAVSPVGGEIGTLVTSFNRMLDEIQRRDAELREAQDLLESRVASRTDELAQAKADLEERAAELLRSNEELEQFAYVASHDLQEPLRTVSSYMQLLRRRYGGSLDSDADAFIDFAVEGAVRMQALIRDLLAFSRVTTRGRPLEVVDAEAVLRDVEALLAASVTEARASILHDVLLPVRADSAQFSQVFQNVLSNAIKFRRPDVRPEIRIRNRREGERVVFTVADNGIGIEEAFQKRVFVIFQRLHTREMFTGTGIGLSICKRIVERHGGRMWIESDGVEGTEFHFSFPAADAEPIAV